jgi:hypothetical protein
MKLEVQNNVCNYCNNSAIFFIHLAMIDALLKDGLLLTMPGWTIVLYLKMVVYTSIIYLLLWEVQQWL